MAKKKSVGEEKTSERQTKLLMFDPKHDWPNLLRKRSTCMFILGVDHANPNGTSDSPVGGPRQEPDGNSFISSCCHKRKVRDLLENRKSPVYEDLKNILGFDENRMFIFESWDRGTEELDAVSAKNWALNLFDTDPIGFMNRYFDVRLFGLSAFDGEDSGNRRRTGVVTVPPMLSVAPIECLVGSGSRKSPLRLAEEMQGDLTPRSICVVKNAVYVGRMSINPHFSSQTGTTNEDIRVLKGLLKYAWSVSTSSTRPGGSIQPIHIWWADHENSLCSFNEFDFWNKLAPVKKSSPNEPSSSFNDYHFPNPEEVGLGHLNVVDLCEA